MMMTVPKTLSPPNEAVVLHRFFSLLLKLIRMTVVVAKVGQI
jgi:hypothetical protein